MEQPSLRLFKETEKSLINNELLYLTVEYMDFYLKTTRNTVQSKDLSLIAGVCLFMASKFLYNFRHISLNELAIDILEMQFTK